MVEDFGATDPLSQSVIPYAQLVHDRLSVEVLRGCARGCRFCQAGITYRPVRERSADQIVSAVTRGLAKTGYDEVSLTSLSTTDHSCCEQILSRLNRRLEDTGISVSIPSQRLDSFGVNMALQVAGEKKGGLTFAPEAGSQRMRDVINKGVTEEDLERATRRVRSGLASLQALFHDGASWGTGRRYRRDRQSGRPCAGHCPRSGSQGPTRRYFRIHLRFRFHSQIVHAVPMVRSDA